MLYIIVFFILSVSIIYLINYLSKIGHPITFSSNYYYKRYYCKKLSMKERELLIEDLKTVAINSINLIPAYDIFKNKNMDDKIAMIIYDRKTNLPIACNVSFYFKYQNLNIMHLGLYLIDQKFQKKGLQVILFILHNINFLIESNFFYNFTDLGRSASGFRNIDIKFKCYPSLNSKVDDNFKNYSQGLAKYFFDNYACNNAGVSALAKINLENNIVEGSNLKDGDGFHELLKFESSRKSRHTDYNNFIADNCKNIEDEFIIVAKVTPYNLLKIF